MLREKFYPPGDNILWVFPKIYMGLKVFGLEHKQGDMYKRDKVNIPNTLRWY